MKHVVMFSGGIGSYMCAKRVIAQHGTGNTILLFADTSMEDEDLYRFLDDASNSLQCGITTVRDGRTPWQVYRDAKFIGNTRVDLCSRVLKREPCTAWLKDNCDPDDTIIYVGIGWSEIHRFQRIQELNTIWRYEAPMCNKPYLSPAQCIAEVISDGLAPPRLYADGFTHNNCGGFCCKAGQAHFANLLNKNPSRYRYHEQQEMDMRKFLNKDVSILRDRSGGLTTPLTLEQFRKRKEQGLKHDSSEWGGCGCFAGSE